MLDFPINRKLACITIGRANLDLYPPPGQKIVQARQYDAFVGGSPANIAAGIIRRGLKAGIITKVADDGIGHFVREYLEDFGIDISMVKVETSDARTSLAFAERRRDAETVFYRQQPSDLLLSPDDICTDYIASSQVLFLSGSALCQEPCRSAVRTAINAAQVAGTIVAMDIDYRPHGWESLEVAAKILQEFASDCQLLLGTSDEFAIASGSVKTTSAGEDTAYLKQFPKAQFLVIKRNKDGANAYLRTGGNLEEIKGILYPAALQKPWGAGDSFASSLLASLLQGKSCEQALRDGAASASLNISGTSCTEAMPSSDEIARFIDQAEKQTLPPEWKD